MKFLAIASALIAAASTALAAPNGCVTQKQANLLVNRFASLQTKQGSDLGDFTKTANAILAKEFVVLSDSVLSLQNKPLGTPVFQGKAAYIAGVSRAPPATGVNTLAVYVAGCNKVLWQWRFDGVGSAEYPVKGFNLFTVNRKNQLTKAELEFNSIAWGKDTAVLPTEGAEPATEPADESAPETSTSETSTPETST